MIGRDLRASLHSAFVAVRSDEANKAIANITLDHVIEQQLKFLKKDSKRSIVDPAGQSMGERVSRYDALKLLEDSLMTALYDIRKAENAESPEDALAGIGIYEVNDKYLEKNPTDDPEPGVYDT